MSDRTLSMQERHRNKQYNAKTFKELWGQWPGDITLQPPLPVRSLPTQLTIRLILPHNSIVSKCRLF